MKGSLLNILLLLALAPLASIAHARPYPGGGDDSVPTPSPVPSQAFSYEDLTNIIVSNNVTSIDALLPLLPKNYRSHYLFFYDSQSLQAPQTTPTLPRTILFGSDAKLVMTFTGAPDPTLETVAWDESGQKFVFRELLFDGKSNPLARTPEENPATCLKCHGNPPRPNWASYNFWPGSYGSSSRLDCDAIEKGTVEWANYQKFLKTGRHAARYADLPPEQYAVEIPFIASPGANEVCVRDATGDAAQDDLSNDFSALNVLRVRAELEGHSRYPAFKYALASVVKCVANPITDFFPASLQSQGLSPASTLNTVRSSERQAYAARLSDLLKTNPVPMDSTYAPNYFMEDVSSVNSVSGNIEVNEIDAMARLQYVAQRMGVDVHNWFMAFDLSQKTYELGNAIDGAAAVLDQMLSLSGSESSLSCADLARKSKAALAGVTASSGQFFPIGGIPPASSEFAQFQICLNCHGTDGPARFPLDLSSEPAFISQLKSTPGLADDIKDHLRGSRRDGTSVIKMPLGIDLGAEGGKMIQYIESIQ